MRRKEYLIISALALLFGLITIRDGRVLISLILAFWTEPGNHFLRWVPIALVVAYLVGGAITCKVINRDRLQKFKSGEWILLGLLGIAPLVMSWPILVPATQSLVYGAWACLNPLLPNGKFGFFAVSMGSFIGGVGMASLALCLLFEDVADCGR